MMAEGKVVIIAKVAFSLAVVKRSAQRVDRNQTKT